MEAERDEEQPDSLREGGGGEHVVGGLVEVAALVGARHQQHAQPHHEQADDGEADADEGEAERGGVGTYLGLVGLRGHGRRPSGQVWQGR